jgi:demethylmenaquinone methyltransferase/2-methoxy-6-polyprenyl-1,4-benzoquinol methylase
MEAYYERRAPEYDDWYLGRGRFADRDRPGFAEELDEVLATLSSLPAEQTLDVGCGTGFVSRHLRGLAAAVDRSPGMLAIARARVDAPVVRADLLRLPFRDRAFGRLIAAHVYGHLTPDRARAFRDEAFRVAPEVVILDAALHAEVDPEQVQERVLNDGSEHRVYKRWFDATALVDELGGGETLHAGPWFVLVRADGRMRSSR